MEGQHKQFDLKVIIGILLLAVLALAAIFFFNNRQVKKELDGLAMEREVIKAEFEDVKKSLNTLAAENEQYSLDIQRSQERIQRLLDSIADLEKVANQMQNYRNRVVALQRQNKELRRLVDTLKKNNEVFQEEIGSAKTTIADLSDSVTRYSEQEQEEIKAQQEIQQRNAKDASNLQLVDLEGNAYLIRPNGNLIETKRAGKVQRIRACFTISPNPMVSSGEKEFYLRFIDPNGNTVPNMGSFMTANNQDFSKKTIVLYKNEPLAVCDFISVSEDQLVPGDYQIQIYFNQQLIASTTFELK